MVSRRTPDTDVVEEAGARQRPKEGKLSMSGGEGTRVREGTEGTEEEAKKRDQEWRMVDGQGSPEIKGRRLENKGAPIPSSAIFYLHHSSLMQAERLRARAGVTEKKMWGNAEVSLMSGVEAPGIGDFEAGEA